MNIMYMYMNTLLLTFYHTESVYCPGNNFNRLYKRKNFVRQPTTIC